ncbi:MAG: response regulator transcription factor [Oscillatoriales cyanobacterium RM2_1_1]|nr:response regulator transcription factor [Oscillatoriales cyanobacterium RM2_1_1]
MDKIRVVLVEDHNLTRIGLCTALKQSDSIEIVGDAANGHQGLYILQQSKPDVAIIDIGLPDMDGVELTQKYKQTQIEAGANPPKVMMLTMHDDETAVLSAFAAGADSYSLKDISMDNLIQAIHLTHSGDSWIDPAIARIVLQQARRPDEGAGKPPTTAIEALDPKYQHILETDPLTERELEVLELIVGGCSNADIAAKLYITVGTVKTHVRSILNKLCVDDRTQAAVRALRSGLVG